MAVEGGAVRLAGRAVVVLGYGHQGRAQALCLRDSGVRVTVGSRPGAGFESARADGFTPVDLAAAAASREAAFVACLLPDEVLPEVFSSTIARALAPDTAVVLAHGFAAVYGGLAAPPGHDLLLVAPAAPGVELRAEFEAGRSVPFYAAFVTDSSGRAREKAHDYAEALGASRPGGTIIETTARAETEVDLFGEQAVVVGGVLELVQAAFQTLVDAGYDERLAYLECVHQLKHLVDVIHDEGPDGLRDRISATALYGALTRGPRVVNATSRAAMANLLEEIRSGAFAGEWEAESAAGRKRLAELRAAARALGMARSRSRALGEASDPATPAAPPPATPLATPPGAGPAPAPAPASAPAPAPAAGPAPAPSTAPSQSPASRRAAGPARG
ncbi:MAG: ketol-acid reductoisomerase [Candidatus Eiseniibacteriota bacterium]